MEEASVVVVGAGIAGLISALVATKLGHKVAVIESTTRAGGLWSSRQVRLADKQYTVDEGLRLPVKSGFTEWDNLIFHNASCDFDWLKFQGWPYEASAFLNTLTPESSCVDARRLGSTNLELGIAEMVASLQGRPNLTLDLYSSDAEYLAAQYGHLFTQSIFNEIAKSILGFELRELAPGTIHNYVPKRLILCAAGEIESFSKKYPMLFEYVAHESHASLPSSGGKEFLYPANNGIVSWIEGLKSYLISCGVKFHWSDRVRSIHEIPGNRIAIATLLGSSFEPQTLIWSIAPTLTKPLLPIAATPNINPHLMSLGIQHLKLDRRPTDMSLQYLLNFEQRPAFFRAIFWDRIVEKKSHLVTLEHLLEPKDPLAISNKTLAENALHQLQLLGAVDCSCSIEDSDLQIYQNVLPRMTPGYWRDNANYLEKVSQLFPSIKFVGRSAGKERFLDGIIRDVISVLEGET